MSMDIEEIRRLAGGLTGDSGGLQGARTLKRIAALLYQLAVEQERFENWAKSEIERLEWGEVNGHPGRGAEAQS